MRPQYEADAASQFGQPGTVSNLRKVRPKGHGIASLVVSCSNSRKRREVTRSQGRLGFDSTCLAARCALEPVSRPSRRRKEVRASTERTEAIVLPLAFLPMLSSLLNFAAQNMEFPD
ncbi:hypothetical protein ACQR1Y_06055 [Bradyrhizobium sp. HKCCYLRH3099]|uniref:hypothetical protein n=1 Tax=unclassified Bradyrhizobium TaxID=2631580 RepID=UPI003EBE6E86